MSESAGVYLPLGILYVAGHLKAHTRHEVSALDAIAGGLSYADLEAEIRRAAPQVVGLSATTFNLRDVLETARIAKTVDSRIHVNVGGPHTQIYPRETAALPHVDSVTIGDGEETFTALVNTLESGGDLRTVPGLAFKQGEDVCITDERPPAKDLDPFPFPARELLPIDRYYSGISDKKFSTLILSSRGCPFNCQFCFSKSTKYRERSPANIVAEIEACVKMGISEFKFVDETFNVHPKKVREFCELVQKKQLRITWEIRGRIDRQDPDLLRTMKRAGCTCMYFGVEAGTDDMLKLIRKGITVEQARDAFALTRRIGIRTVAYFMIGHPTETREQIWETIRFSKALKPDYAVYSIFVPYPCTAFYAMGLETGLIKQDYWQAYAADPIAQFRPRVWEENFTEQELLELLEAAYKHFYMDARYVFRRVMATRSLAELSRHARTALKILRFRR
ncbi:MAG: radical SAM protein [Kiritimatiellae bacterium]|nr:radical SAM protein [Kiritimatiellia bacterium]